MVITKRCRRSCKTSSTVHADVTGGGRGVTGEAVLETDPDWNAVCGLSSSCTSRYTILKKRVNYIFYSIPTFSILKNFLTMSYH